MDFRLISTTGIEKKNPTLIGGIFVKKELGN